MSVIGALVGEFVASERGLGSLIITGGVTMQTPSIFASLILISALGLVLYGLVVAVERIVAPWAQRDDDDRMTTHRRQLMNRSTTTIAAPLHRRARSRRCGAAGVARRSAGQVARCSSTGSSSPTIRRSTWR